MTASLKQQAEDFANDLTRTVRAVVGEECPAFAADVIEEARAFRVRQDPASGIILCDSDNAAILRLDVDYKCIYDDHYRYMAIAKSRIRVFVEPCGREPLFRYEFVRDANPNIPSAHIQFHGTHPELKEAMEACGDATERAKARKRGREPVRLDALHFPVGGARFRPVLEDVLEMLIEEFGVSPVGGVSAARATLADARERWRRTQVATVVRDAPADAAAALEALGYQVMPPEPPAPEKRNKLRSY